MALSLIVWNALSLQDKNAVINFLRGNCKIDREHPVETPATTNSYPISDGTTIGGHKMKFSEEYRIYIKDLHGIPSFLDAELRERGAKNRIGGSDAIREIMRFGGFQVGNN